MRNKVLKFMSKQENWNLFVEYFTFKDNKETVPIDLKERLIYTLYSEIEPKTIHNLRKFFTACTVYFYTITQGK